MLDGSGCAWGFHFLYTAESLIRSKKMSDLKGIDLKISSIFGKTEARIGTGT